MDALTIVEICIGYALLYSFLVAGNYEYLEDIPVKKHIILCISELVILLIILFFVFGNINIKFEIK